MKVAEANLDLNSCSEQTLLGVPGIGKECARHLLAERNSERGPFLSWDDFVARKIPNFGPKRVQHLQAAGLQLYSPKEVAAATQLPHKHLPTVCRATPTVCQHPGSSEASTSGSSQSSAITTAAAALAPGRPSSEVASTFQQQLMTSSDSATTRTEPRSASREAKPAEAHGCRPCMWDVNDCPAEHLHRQGRLPMKTVDHILAQRAKLRFSSWQDFAMRMKGFKLGPKSIQKLQDAGFQLMGAPTSSPAIKVAASGRAQSEPSPSRQVSGPAGQDGKAISLDRSNTQPCRSTATSSDFSPLQSSLTPLHLDMRSSQSSAAHSHSEAAKDLAAVVSKERPSLLQRMKGFLRKPSSVSHGKGRRQSRHSSGDNLVADTSSRVTRRSGSPSDSLDGDAAAEIVQTAAACVWNTAALPGTAEQGSGCSGIADNEHATSSQSAYWFHDSREASRPFPLEFQDPRYPVTPAYHFIAISAAVDGKGMLCYGKQQLTAQEADALRASWQAKYPCIPQANTKGNLREQPSQRAAGTSKPANRLNAWDTLGQLEATALIPPAWQKRFRSDPYGNVVSIDAKGGAVCAFELDHIFPWSRGGLSVPANFMAMYYGANRYIKRDKIPNGLTQAEMDAMQCGLSVERFLGLLKQREGLSRAKAKQYDQLLELLLLMPYSQPWQLASVLTDDNALRLLNTSYQASLVDLMG